VLEETNNRLTDTKDVLEAEKQHREALLGRQVSFECMGVWGCGFGFGFWVRVRALDVSSTVARVRALVVSSTVVELCVAC
jgi:hypothetical protein